MNPTNTVIEAVPAGAIAPAPRADASRVEEPAAAPEALSSLALRTATCASAFGAACGAGLGPRAMLHGAWAGPALFLGGSLLALGPLYLASAVSGTAIAPLAVARASLSRTARGATVLLGLVPAALLFSTTLHGELAFELLLGVVGAVFAFGAYAVAAALIDEDTSLVQRTVFAAWVLFAWLLGARMVGVIASAIVAPHGGMR